MTVTDDTRVIAVLNADDGSRIVSFDAFPCLAEESWHFLSELVECGFSGDYAADQVARYMAASHYLPDGPRLKDAIEDIANRDVGFEVHVDSDEALLYLAEHRLDWLLHDVFTRIHARDEAQAHLTSPDDRHTRLSQADGLEVGEVVARAFYNCSDAGVARLADIVSATVYRLAFVLGPTVRVTELLTEPDITAALNHSAQHTARAALYRAAGIPADEARHHESDPAQRQDDNALRTLAALRGALAPPVG